LAFPSQELAAAAEVQGEKFGLQKVVAVAIVGATAEVAKASHLEVLAGEGPCDALHKIVGPALGTCPQATAKKKKQKKGHRGFAFEAQLPETAVGEANSDPDWQVAEAAASTKASSLASDDAEDDKARDDIQSRFIDQHVVEEAAEQKSWSDEVNIWTTKYAKGKIGLDELTHKLRELLGEAWWVATESQRRKLKAQDLGHANGAYKY
jgi:hypothetical protein